MPQPDQPSPRRITRPLDAPEAPARARVPGTIAPVTNTPPKSRSLWAWIALPALLACLIAALAFTMMQPSAGQTLGAVEIPTVTPTEPFIAVATATSAPVLVIPTATAEPPTAAPTDTVAPPTDTPAPLPTDTAVPPADTPVPPTDTPLPEPTDTPLPQLEQPGPGQGIDPITGQVADQDRLNRKPVVVMIDNHPDAAPQTGLNRADMVIEALAEGGITRFETFFYSGDAGTVGPVRSARPYFVEWAYPFHPFIVHCGGSWEAIDLIEESSALSNVDCFDSSQPFWRSDDRAMPHNLYATTDQLWNRNLGATENMPGFLHSPMAPREQRPAEATLSFAFTSLSRSDVNWYYDADSGMYLRSQWGYQHQDYVTGERVSAANVVVLWTNVWNLPNDDQGRLGTDTIGQNTALIMRDGQFEWGYWKRDSVDQPIQLLNGKMEPMALAPGRIWFEVLGIGKKVEISPEQPQ